MNDKEHIEDVNNDETKNTELKPVKRAVNRIVSYGAVVALGGLAFSIILPVAHPLPGATRSSRIKLEEREAEFEAAIQQEQLEKEQVKLEQE